MHGAKFAIRKKTVWPKELRIQALTLTFCYQEVVHTTSRVLYFGTGEIAALGPECMSVYGSTCLASWCFSTLIHNFQRGRWPSYSTSWLIAHPRLEHMHLKYQIRLAQSPLLKIDPCCYRKKLPMVSLYLGIISFCRGCGEIVCLCDRKVGGSYILI